MRFRTLKNLLFLCGLLVVFNLSYADTVNTQLSRDKISLGESFTVSFILNGNTSAAAPDFSALEQDFRILSSNYGTAINMLNGVTTTQTFWRLTLEPKKVGAMIIPEINFGNVKSISRKLIVEQAPDHILNDNQDASAFVQAQLSTTTPYIQSQVLYTFKLFYQSQLENPRIEIPEIKDSKFVQLDDGNQYQTTIKGKTYFVIEKNLAFFPEKPGKVFIPPAHFSASTYTLDPGMMNNPFYVPTAKPFSLSTQAFTMNVQKIPDQFQGSTWLPAKNIALTEKWSVNTGQWESGNPVTRTITVEANGLRADQIPDFAIDKISGMNIYVDPPRRSNSVQSNTLTGTLEQKVTYIPNGSQSFTIPALKLIWWNISTNKAVVAQLNSFTVQVKANITNTHSNNAPITAAFDTSKPAVKSAIVEPKTKTNPFYLTIWFWIATFLFAIWLMTLWLFWNKKSAKNIMLSEQDKPALPIELSAKSFTQACEQGNTVLAQQFLLSWAKKQWQDTPLNLDKLCEIVSDENFKSALKNLEQAIYAKNTVPWNGHTLLSAYQKVTKQQKHYLPALFKTKNAQQRQPDLLPPLNPHH